MLPAPTIMTADELLTLHLPDKRTELVRGRLVVREPAGLPLLRGHASRTFQLAPPRRPALEGGTHRLHQREIQHLPIRYTLQRHQQRLR